MNRYMIKRKLVKFLKMLINRKDCWQCGGTGVYWTEMMALYDDHGIVCPTCKGKGYQKYFRRYK